MVEPIEPHEVPAVTGRPNDIPIRKPEDAIGASTFAERAKQRQASEKRIASAQNKAVQSSDNKGNLDSLKKDELIALAEQRGVAVPAGATKADLVALLS